MRGRKPKPTGLRLIEGNPGKRALPKNEPKPSHGCSCPSTLSERAKREWRRLYPELYRTGIVTTVDRAALAEVCEAWAEWVEVHDAWDATKRSFVIKTTAGNVIQNPIVGAMHTAAARLVKALAEFGLTPSARSRVESVDPPAPEQGDIRRFVKKIAR